MRVTIFTIVVILNSLLAHSQSDNVGSGHAIYFDGVDDFIDLGNIYDDINFPITISSWVKLSSTVTNWAPIFVSQDNDPIYNGFWLIVQPTAVGVGYGDGMGENLPIYRRSKTAFVPDISERWVHITAIINGPVDMKLFVNGVDVGGSYTGSSNLPMNASPSDVAKIGYWYSNGLQVKFKGAVDEIRLWNRALTLDEIRDKMCKKIIGPESALVGNWSFNQVNSDIVLDNSGNGYNGRMVNGPKRQYSGAPIGDHSAYLYTDQWELKELALESQERACVVRNVRSTSQGVHVYAVNEMPSQRIGLDNCLVAPYFGVFVVDQTFSGIFDISFHDISGESNDFKAKLRVDNSIPLWVAAQINNVEPNSINNQTYRGEYILANSLSVALGEDTVVCDKSDFIVQSKLKYSGDLEYLWNTGEDLPEISVNKNGNYWVQVTSTCDVSRDTISVSFLTSPLFSLGEDINLCPGNTVVLQPIENSFGFSFLWSDLSIEPYLEVSSPGTYGVKVENVCGAVYDEIQVNFNSTDPVFIPNVISPQSDDWNQKFEIDPQLKGKSDVFIFNRWGNEVFSSTSYDNDWDGGDLPAGIYFYVIKSLCVDDIKGTLSILR